MRVFIGSNQSQDNHSKEGVLGKITNFSSQINKSLLFPEMPKVKGPKLFQKGSHPRIKNEYLKQSIQTGIPMNSKLSDRVMVSTKK